MEKYALMIKIQKVNTKEIFTAKLPKEKAYLAPKNGNIKANSIMVRYKDTDKKFYKTETSLKEYEAGW